MDLGLSCNGAVYSHPQIVVDMCLFNISRCAESGANLRIFKRVEFIC